MKGFSLVKDPSFYKRFFSIWSVLVLYNMITLGVNLADNVMVGTLGETALSGVTAVNQVQFLFHQLILGASDAVVVLGSQYWGQKRTKEIKRFSVGALLLGSSIGLVLFLLASFFPDAVVGVFTESAEIRAAGVEYLNIIKYSYVLFALTNLLLAVLRSAETVRIGFWVSLSTLFVNISLNYLLIGGHLGFPALGVRGAAIATLAARCVELLIVVVYLLNEKKLSWRLSDFLPRDRVLIRDYVKLCAPFLFTSFLFGAGSALQTVILGHMTDIAISANSVANTLYQMLKVAAIGAASAASILIGTAIGSGKKEVIRSYTQTLQVMFLSIGLCISLSLFLLRAPVIGLYPNLTEETKTMATHFIWILCFTGFGTAYEMPVITGIIRGGGDAKFVFINDLISIWGIVMPLSFLAAFVFHWSPEAVILCLNADQVFKCIPGAIKANRYHWMKKLTRDASAS